MNYYRKILILTVLLTGSLIAVGNLQADFRADYNSAYESFQASKTAESKKAAAERFLKLALRDDAGSLRANAYYWAAESWYGLKNYARALNSFEKVLLIPQSNKEEHARFKVSMCYARLEKNKAARWEMERFIRDFPSSSLVNNIKKELKKIPVSGYKKL